MKPLSLVIVLCAYLSTDILLAQAPSNTGEHKKKLEIFANWVGQWKGQGTIQRGPGNSSSSEVTEDIEMKLDGSLIVMEGIGKRLDEQTKSEKIVHHAFGVLSYDTKTAQYKFKTYLAEGLTADAWFNVVGENKYQWGFDVPQGKIRYTITIDPVAKTWQEVGEYSSDEKTWYKTFEMNLKKV
jgi:hypothetical protein